MATNEKFRDAERLSLPVPSGTVSGGPVLVGALVGVCETNRDANGNAAVWMKGAHNLSVTGAVTQIGSPVYITGSNTLTTTATSNTLFGYALATKSSGAGVIPVKISLV